MKSRSYSSPGASISSMTSKPDSCPKYPSTSSAISCSSVGVSSPSLIRPRRPPPELVSPTSSPLISSSMSTLALDISASHRRFSSCQSNLRTCSPWHSYLALSLLCLTRSKKADLRRSRLSCVARVKMAAGLALRALRAQEVDVDEFENNKPGWVPVNDVGLLSTESGGVTMVLKADWMMSSEYGAGDGVI